MPPTHGAADRPRRSPLHSLTTLTRPQKLVIAVTLVATIVGITALTLALSQPPSPAAPPTASSPPLRATPFPGSPVQAVSVPDTTRLVIPAGHIDIRVIPGDGVHIPLYVALHYAGTGWPGGGTNSLFYAHARAGMFGGLYDLRLGDEIRAVRADGSQLLYRVRGLRKVAFNDDRVLQPTSFEQITLLTCTSYDPYTPRYIVTATPA